MPDPYSDFWGLFQSQGEGKTTPFVTEGRVASTQPLRISAAGLIYERHELRVNEALLSAELKHGDSVLCLTCDGWQTLFILCKVVTP